MLRLSHAAVHWTFVHLAAALAPADNHIARTTQ